MHQDPLLQTLGHYWKSMILWDFTWKNFGEYLEDNFLKKQIGKTLLRE